VADLERLVVSLEARINSYEKTMAKMLGVTNQRVKQVENRFDQMKARISGVGVEAFRGFAAGALGTLGPLLSVAAAVNTAKAAMQEFGDIADNAKAAGLDSEFFQSLAYQASQGGIGIEQMSSALATFAKNSGLAVVGKGKMVAALKELNPQLLENIRSATTQEQRIKLVADALAGEADASRKAAIATATFGDAGSKLADVFAGGAAQIDAMMVKAKDLGLVVDRELIARADELGDEFDTTTRIVDLKLKQALVNLGPVLVWLSGLAGGLAEQLGRTIEGWGSMEGRSTRSLVDRLNSIRTQTASPFDSPNLAQVAGMDPAQAAEERRRIEAEIFRRGERSSMSSLNATTAPTTAPLPTLDEIETRKESAKAAVKQGDAVKQLIADLQLEGATIGKTTLQQQIMTNLHRVNADAASEEGKQIAALTEANYIHAQQVEALQDVYAELGNIGQSAVKDIIAAMADGKIEAAEFGDILSNVLGMAGQFFLNQAFSGFGGGGGSNFLGSLFGGKRARGGPVEAGKIYKVNENTPNSEYWMPNVNGMVVPKVNAGGAGGGVNVNAPITINGNADAMTVQQLRHWSRFELPAMIRHHSRTTMPENG
jgi:hypothetical protein